MSLDWLCFVSINKGKENSAPNDVAPFLTLSNTASGHLSGEGERLQFNCFSNQF